MNNGNNHFKQRTLSSLDKERDGSSSSETTPPEDERDEPMVTDRIQSSRSPVFDHVKGVCVCWQFFFFNETPI